MLECIDLHLGAAGTLNEWRFRFKSHYDTLQPFLSLTGGKAAFWCCPFNGRRQLLVEDAERNGTNAPDCMNSPCLEAKHIASADLELWEFCPSAVAAHLGVGLGLHIKPGRLKGTGLRIGSLIYKARSFPAFLLKNGDSG